LPQVLGQIYGTLWKGRDEKGNVTAVGILQELAKHTRLTM